MKVNLEALACTCIKRRKPWPIIQWIGKEKEIILLLDENRVSVLYIPSGKTKRKIPKLSPLVEESLVISRTPDGHFLAGLLKSGDIFLWNKDKDIVKTISELSKHVNLTSLLTECCSLFVSNDCTKVLLVVGTQLFFVWKSSHTGNVFEENLQVVKGQWSNVIIPDKICLPSSDCLEKSTAGTFYTSQMSGSCCQWSVTFNQGQSLCVSTLHLHFLSHHEAALEKSSVSIRVEWCCFQYPINRINPGCEAINARGAYVTQYSQDGQLLAVAVNQRSPSNSAMLFVSPLTDTVLVSEMKGCGLKHPDSHHGRKYWVRDMTWTSDQLFLACILNNGSVALMPRLGEPIALEMTGMSLDMGPSYFLPLHPLIQLQSDEGSRVVSEVMSINDPLAQKFSVTSHPALPILLFSDGYNVSLVQTPGELTLASFMTDLILESSRHLEHLKTQENLDMTLVNAYNFSNQKPTTRLGEKGSRHTSSRLKEFLSNLDATNESLNESQTSELSLLLDEEYQYGGMEEMTSGKIVFGEDEHHLATMDGSFSSMGDRQATYKHLQHAKLNLWTVWKLAATCSDNWTSRLDGIVKECVKNVYKMFSLMMHSYPASHIIAPNVQPASNENNTLVNVITMYRQLLDVLQFDSLEQHLIPCTLQLAHKTINLILTNKHINRSDPRLKTLSGCFMLLKFTEKVMNRNYVWLPRSLVEKGISPRSVLGRPDQCVPVSKVQSHHQQGLSVDRDSVAQVPTDQLSARRLTATWKLLYQALLEFRRDQSVSEVDLQQSQLLVNAIHETLQMVETDIPGRSQNINPGDAYSLDGQYTHALDVWLQQYRNLHGIGGYSKAAKLLHSLLYTFILRGELLNAVDFIDELVVKSNTTSGVSGQTTKGDMRPALMTLVTTTLQTQGSPVHDSVPCIRDKGIRQVVQSMARFMAAYFSNQSVYIFPPHNPQALPAIHYNSPIINNRIIPQYPEELTQIIRYGNLSDVWTIERTLEYLLLSGLVCEATWFAVRMGDWKAGFLLAVACEQHRQTAPTLYTKPRKPLSLPDNLTPKAILQEKLSFLLGRGDSNDSTGTGSFLVTNETDIDQLTRTVKELMTAGIMCKVEVVPWLLSSLVYKLKTVVRQLQPLVPLDFYLPSPPLYCPQPTNTKKNSSPPSLEREERTRANISSLVQLILAVLSGSHLSLQCMSWYTQQLIAVQEKARQFRANTEGQCTEIPTILQQYNSLQCHLSQYFKHFPTQQVLTSFRDFCSLLWLLHARDKLCLKLREKEKYLNAPSKKNEDQDEWIQEYFTTLQWAVHLLNFSSYLVDEGSIYKVVLSLLMELPPSEESADILAEHFYNPETLDAEVQEKLEKVLSYWEGVILEPEDDGRSAKDAQGLEDTDGGTDVRRSVTFKDASPRGISLSSYFSKQCQAVTKVLKKKAKVFGCFEEFLFTNIDNKDLNDVNLDIGSRPFETKQSFFEFLDTFAAISFEKLMDLQRSSTRPRDLPLLESFSNAIISKELAVFSEKDFSSPGKKKYSLIVMSSSKSSSRTSLAFARSQSILTQRYNSNLSLDAGSPRSKPPGLFRSKSVQDPQSKAGPVKRYLSEGGLDVLMEESKSVFVDQSKRSLQRNDSDEPDVWTKESPSKSVFVNQSKRSSHKNPQANVSDLASRFSESEDHLYRPESDENNSWSLDVKFGRKYKLLQLLLDWLEVWCRKNHSFGLQEQEMFDGNPTVKIQIPSQLILLSLWLLEYKYNPNANAIHDAGQGFISSPPEKKKKKPRKKPTQDVMEKHPLLNLSQRSVSSSKDRTISSRENVAGKSSTLDEDGVRDAYKHALVRENEDESSLSGSSLQSYELFEELRQSISVIKGTGSPTREVSLLNEKIYPRTSSEHNTATSTPISKNRGNRNNSGTGSSRVTKTTTTKTTKMSSQSEKTTSAENVLYSLKGKGREPRQSRTVSPERSSILKSSLTSSLERSTSPRNTKRHTEMNSRSASPQFSVKANRSRSHSPDSKVPSSHVSRRDAYNHSPNFDQGFGSNLASQLQNIVRSEMRRIMEVQHQSLMAMMGAIDDQPPQNFTDKNLPRVQSNRRDYRPNSPSHQQRQTSLQNTADTSMYLDDLETSRHRGPQKREKGAETNVKVDRVLQELKHLQRENIQPSSHTPQKGRAATGKENTGLGVPLLMQQVTYSQQTKPTAGKENDGLGIPLLRLDNDGLVGFASDDHMNKIPKFLRMKAEKDTDQPNFFFPKIPQQAWPEKSANFKPNSGESVKLLKLQPPSQIYFHQSVSDIPKMPIPNQRQPFSVSTKDPRHQFGIPLLRLQDPKPQNKGKSSTFGKLVDPGLFIKQEELLEQVENERTKLLEKKQVPEANLSMDGSKKKSKTASKGKQKPIQEVVEEVEEEEEKDEEEEDGEEEVESESEEEEKIHDGFVIPPGAFDGFLDKDKMMGPDVDSNIKFQYLLALKMKEQRKKVKKVDFATMTKEMIDAIAEPDPEEEIVRRADAWTSITKDTGCDPIQEAMLDYGRSHPGQVLPPDIYLQLGFSDGREGENQEKGRSYLNVVDIKAPAILKDIRERAAERERKLRVQVDSSPQEPQDLEQLEESARARLQPTAPQRIYGYDQVTAKMLDRKNKDLGQEDYYLGTTPARSLRFSKTHLVKRLKEINDQVAAIDQMSQNIEKDFQSSKRMISTLESLNEAQHPVVTEQEQKLQDLEYEQDEDFTEEVKSDKEKHSPKSSKTSPVSSPRKSTKSSTHRSTGAKTTERTDLHISGLSDLSEIIGEVLLEGGVNLEGAGLSPAEAEDLKQKARMREVVHGSTGVETLEDLIHQTDATKDEAEKKRILHKWMAERRIKQQEEYRQRRDELREYERYPYRPPGGFDSTFTGREIETNRRERQANRRKQETTFMIQRMLEAEKLMGDMLVHPPSPTLPPTQRSLREKTKPRPKFGATRTIKKPPIAKKANLRTLKTTTELKIRAKEWEEMRPRVASLQKSKWRVDGRVGVPTIAKRLRGGYAISGSLEAPPISWRRTADYQRQRKARERKWKEERLADIAEKYEMSRLDFDWLEEDQERGLSVESSGDLIEYAKHVAARESQEITDRSLSPVVHHARREYRSQSPEGHHARRDYKTKKQVTQESEEIPERSPSPEARHAQIEYKPKKFTELVKLQRPEITRRDVAVKPSESYVERLSSLTPREVLTDRSNRSTADLKATRKLSTPTVIKSSEHPAISGNRRVKTYAERLKEMKPRQKFSTPIVPRASLGNTYESQPMTTYRPKSIGPPHKPLTYVQQLQKLNKQAPKYKGKKMSSIPVRTVLKSHKPFHKPKTYVEQLQTIQSNAPETVRRRTLMQKTSSIRDVGRSRPYRDPYRDIHEEDLHSVLSSWSVDDDVRKLLYDDEDASLSYNGLTAMSSELLLSDASDYFDTVMADHYVGSVDIDEIEQIARAASVHSGSILSEIDWDQVDDLIADVGLQD